MLHKLWSIQHILDTLFDDGWCQLGLPEQPEPDTASGNHAARRGPGQGSTAAPHPSSMAAMVPTAGT